MATLPSYKQEVMVVLKKYILRLQSAIDANNVQPQQEIKKLVWKTIAEVQKAIQPENQEQGGVRKQAWREAKSMLKTLVVDFVQFSPGVFNEAAFVSTVEEKVLQMLKRYERYVLTGSREDKHPEPKILGETDNVLCVDKPSKYKCSYGDHKGFAPDLQNAKSCSELLNGEQENIQIHEYLALKFKYETATKTREFWEHCEWKKQQWMTGNKQQSINCEWKEQWHPCQKVCGKCKLCCYSQTGCCHRLDKETSGVLVTAKTFDCFSHVRSQFELKNGKGNEDRELKKFYIALCQGYIHVASGERRRVDYDCIWDDEKHRMRQPTPNDRESSKLDSLQNNADKSRGQKGSHPTQRGVQSAVTYYEPLAWYERDHKQYTLVLVQIITGRRHQIRFHMSEIGFPLVGDTHYGADDKIRNWSKRIFLHSYSLRFTEPDAHYPYRVTSPLPEDLGLLLEDLNCLNAPEPNGGPLLSRRQHRKLQPSFQQYDSTKPLMVVDSEEAHKNSQGKCLQDAWGAPPPAKKTRLANVA